MLMTSISVHSKSIQLIKNFDCLPEKRRKNRKYVVNKLFCCIDTQYTFNDC